MKQTKTAQIEEEIFKLLQNHPEGISWAEILRQVTAKNPTFHPKTVNGLIWKLPQKYPDKIFKPGKGIFKLKKPNNK
jgi:hypothetical protein